MKFHLKLHPNVLGNTQQEPYFFTFCRVGTNHVNILVSGFFAPILGFLGDYTVLLQTLYPILQLLVLRARLILYIHIWSYKLRTTGVVITYGRHSLAPIAFTILHSCE